MKTRFSHFDKAGGVVYGFSTKTYGSMRPTNTSFEKNLKKFLAAQKLSNKTFVKVVQVHGTRIISIEKEISSQKADGMLTASRDFALGMVSADCLPVLFYDPKQKLIALVHAGWKGVVKGIISETVSELLKNGAQVSELLVGIGPSIQACCYSVEEERISVFANRFPASFLKAGVRKKDTSWHLSLQEFVIQDLIRQGVSAKHIENTGVCTACEDDYFSYRKAKDKVNFGEFLSIIALHA